MPRHNMLAHMAPGHRRKTAKKAPPGPSRGSELLVKWRGERSQEDVAHLIDIDHAGYCAFETGRRRPGLMRAVRIDTGTGGAVPVASWLDPAESASVIEIKRKSKAA